MGEVVSGRLSPDHPNALVSIDGQYRYWLTRRWSPGEDWCLFCGLNPSTADAREDDPTIRRMVGFARSWGFGGLAVVNLFAYRATDPENLPKDWVTAAGEDNDLIIRGWIIKSDLLVCAWGANPAVGRQQSLIAQMGIWCKEHGRRMRCLGLTKGGHPRHPLYVKADKTPERFE